MPAVWGLIAAAAAPAEWVRDQIRQAKKMTDKPFGVNIMLMSPEADAVAKVVIEEGVQVVTTGAGSPEKYMADWESCRSEGYPGSCFHRGWRNVWNAAAPTLSLRKEPRPADISVRSQPMALVPQVVDAVSIPVIAAGGIADGRGMAAAFMLGAKGVQVGTAFAASKESIIHENYKNSILKAKDIDTRVTGRSTGHPIRVLRNDMTRKYLELEQAGAPFEELESLTLGSLRRAVQEGDVKGGKPGWRDRAPDW